MALVHCPYFSEVSTPLGLAYVASALRKRGHDVVPFDFECWMQIRDRRFYQTYSRAIEQSPNDLIEFVKRPDLVVGALYATGEADWPASVSQADRRMLKKLKDYVETWAQWVASARPDFVMFSMYSSSALASTLLAQRMRVLLPQATIVFGGPGVFSDIVRDFLLFCGLADVVAQGEGEETAVAIVEEGLSPPPMGSSTFVNGKVCTASGRPRMELAQLGVPDFEGFPFPGSDFDSYRLRSHRYFQMLPVSFSRGCVLKCSFCSEWVMWGAGARERPLDKVLREMRDLGTQHRTNNFFVCDSLLNTSAGRVQNVCDELQQLNIPDQPPGVRIQFAYLRPTQLNAREIESLGAAGFRRVSFGIESGSEDLLKLMAKGTKPPAIAEIVRKVISQDIAVQAPFITGFPGETQKELLDSMRFFGALHDSLDSKQRKLLQIIHTRFRLTADSRIHQNPDKFGITLERNVEELRMPLEARQADACNRLFVRWSASDDQSEREFRAKVSEAFLEGFTNFPGEEPPGYIVETGESIGRSIRPGDRFSRGERVVEMAAPADEPGAQKRVLLNVYRRKPIELTGVFSLIYELATRGMSSEQLCAKLAKDYAAPEEQVRKLVLSTVGSLIYQGVLAYDNSAVKTDPVPAPLPRPTAQASLNASCATSEILID
jgi:hypothetical protein